MMDSLFPFASIYENIQHDSYSVTSKASTPQVMGHRGNGFYSPENTILSVSEAIENGADYVELDLALTSDNQIVIFHNAHLDVENACFEGPRSHLIQNLSLEGLQKRYAVRGERIPTLKEMLHAFRKEKVGFQLELKSEPKKGRRNGVNYEDILAASLLLEISEFPRNRIIISSFSIERLQNIDILQSTLLQLKREEYFDTCLMYGGFSRLERKCTSVDCLKSEFLDKAVQAKAQYMSFFSGDFMRIGKQLHVAAVRTGIKLQVGLPGEKGTPCLHGTKDKSIHSQTNIEVLKFAKLNQIEVSFICGNHVRISKLFSMLHYNGYKYFV